MIRSKLLVAVLTLGIFVLPVAPAFAASEVIVDASVSPVPVPAALWLFGSALIGFIGMSRRTQV